MAWSTAGLSAEVGPAAAAVNDAAKPGAASQVVMSAASAEPVSGTATAANGTASVMNTFAMMLATASVVVTCSSGGLPFVASASTPGTPICEGLPPAELESESTASSTSTRSAPEVGPNEMPNLALASCIEIPSGPI